MSPVMQCADCGKFTPLLVTVACNPPYEGRSKRVCEHCAGSVFAQVHVPDRGWTEAVASQCADCSLFTSPLVPVPCPPPYEGHSKLVCERCATRTFSG